MQKWPLYNARALRTGYLLTTLNPVLRIVVAQGVVTLVMAAGWTVSTLAEGASSLAAGVVVVVPNAYFAWRVLTAKARGAANDEARALLGNAVVKLALSVALLVGVFVTLDPAPVAFFATFIAVHATHVIVGAISGPPRRVGKRRGA